MKQPNENTTSGDGPELKGTACSVEFCAAKIGFSVCDERQYEDSDFYEDLVEAFFDQVKGEGYKAEETCNLINGAFFVVEFEELPTPEKLEKVRLQIVGLL